MKKKNISNGILSFIKKNTLVKSGSTIILGLSGGPDSVFLLHVLADLDKKGYIKLIAAHLDHEWRSDSDKDEQFCRQMCKQLGVPYFTAKISELQNLGKFEGSKEEFGRRARRKFLEQVANEHNADAIALAHHAQDQQETFFIRLLRGTSLQGLTGMKPKHGYYIRPLLEINKPDIIDYLDKNKIPYLKDPSNESSKFLRNRIRTAVIPALKKCDPRFDQNFAKTIARLKQAEDFLTQVTKQAFKDISTENNGKQILNIKQLFNLHPALLYRVIIYWLCDQQVKFPPAEQFFDEIIRFLKQPGSKEHQIHPDWKLVKKPEQAWIEK